MVSGLLPKDEGLFLSIMRSCERKKYEKALNAAETILKNYPTHGETLALKGFILKLMNQKKKAYILVELGIKNDSENYVCWRLLGILRLFDKEYGKAIECFQRALLIGGANVQVTEDLSFTQVQMRDWTAYMRTREQLLNLMPNYPASWIDFAYSQYLNSNARKIEILDNYEGNLNEDYLPDSRQNEHGEILLYKISLLENCGLFEKALEELLEKEAEIVDKLAFMEQQVSILEKLGRYSEAEKVYRSLLSVDSDNYGYYEGLQKCLGLHSDEGQYTSIQADELDTLYKTLQAEYASSSVVKRIQLNFLQGEHFKAAADSYCRPLLTKGVPSLFADLSPLYNHTQKAVMLKDLMLSFESSLKSDGRFPGSSSLEPSSTYMWTLVFLAQHYDRLGQYACALAKINEAIVYMPTIIVPYSLRGRILKHAGDLPAAAAMADKARSMDPANQCLNKKCVKRMLQADQVVLAEKTVALFTKDEEQPKNFHDMQCMWYELACGENYYRRGELGLALKNFLAVLKHFANANVIENQFDLHSYYFRKITMGTYIQMTKLKDRLHDHTYVQKAAAGAIRCYIQLFDYLASGIEIFPKLSLDEKKEERKVKKKQRKAEASAEKMEMEEESTASTQRSGKKLISKPVDLDPDGQKLLQVEDPLAEAIKVLELLQNNASASFEIHLLSFEIYMRNNKASLALQVYVAKYRRS